MVSVEILDAKIYPVQRRDARRGRRDSIGPGLVRMDSSDHAGGSEDDPAW